MGVSLYFLCHPHGAVEKVDKSFHMTDGCLHGRNTNGQCDPFRRRPPCRIFHARVRLYVAEIGHASRPEDLWWRWRVCVQCALSVCVCVCVRVSRCNGVMQGVVAYLKE